ncbi:MAG: hypothetical protein AB1705_21375 [Verrucomicrobiota bacterium]
MKHGLIVMGMILLLLAIPSMPAPGAEGELYRAGEYSVDFFGSGTIGQTTIDNLTGSRIRRDVRLGAGMAFNYYVSRFVGLSAEGYSENLQHSLVDDASLNLIVRIPIGGLAPYGIAGAGRQFDPTEFWHGQLGAGLEYRVKPTVGIFFDGRYVMGDGGRDYGMGRAGLRVMF